MSFIGAVFVPASCIFCRQIIEHEKGMGVCPACFGVLPVWDKADIAMPALPKHVDSFDAPFVYEPPVNKAITQMKFADKPEYAYAFSRLMLAKVRSILEEDSLVIPVPMHKKRLFMRQFNQSALIANGLVGLIDAPVELFSLKRLKKTAPQVGKSARARKSNLSGAFWVDEKKVAGKHILLIDDVWTTGSTAEACAKCLKQAGARKVDVVTICYVENSIKGNI